MCRIWKGKGIQRGSGLGTRRQKRNGRSSFWDWDSRETACISFIEVMEGQSRTASSGALAWTITSGTRWFWSLTATGSVSPWIVGPHWKCKFTFRSSNQEDTLSSTTLSPHSLRDSMSLTSTSLHTNSALNTLVPCSHVTAAWQSVIGGYERKLPLVQKKEYQLLEAIVSVCQFSHQAFPLRPQLPGIQIPHWKSREMERLVFSKDSFYSPPTTEMLFFPK